MKLWTKSALVAASFLAFAPTLQAQVFDIRINDWGGINLNDFPQIRDDLMAEIDQIKNDINKDLPNGSPDRLMEGMANSSAMAGKGIGTDYSSSMKKFVVGLGVGAAVDLEKNKELDSKMSGVGVAPGVMFGLNLGFMDTQKILGMETDRLNWFVNFMSYKHDQKMGDGEDAAKINLEMLSFGTHLRYDLVRASGPAAIRWGGVKVTLGFEYNATTTAFSTKINEEIDVTTSTGDRIRGTITGSPTGVIESSTMSIPLSISTDVRLMWFLSLYTGFGAEYNSGKATGKADLNSDDSILRCTGTTACTTPADISASTLANLDASGEVTPFTMRAFLGAQINLPVVKIFVQADKSLTNEVLAGTAGLRLSF